MFNRYSNNRNHFAFDNYDDFFEKYDEADGDWVFPDDYVLPEEDYENEGYACGHEFAVPDSDLLQDEDFMRGYNDGYNDAVDEIWENTKPHFFALKNTEEFLREYLAIGPNKDNNLVRDENNTMSLYSGGWDCGYSNEIPPERFIRNEDFMSGYYDGYMQNDEDYEKEQQERNGDYDEDD